MRNPYHGYEGKQVTLSWSDFGRVYTETGILKIDGYQSTVFLGNWSIGISNIRSIELAEPVAESSGTSK